MVHIAPILAVISAIGASAIPYAALDSAAPAQAETAANLEARKTAPPPRIYGQNPPKGQCRLSGAVSNLFKDMTFRVTNSDGKFVGRTPLSCEIYCMIELLGYGDGFIIGWTDYKNYQMQFYRQGLVSGDRFLNTDDTRCTMSPRKGAQGTRSVVCDFECKQKWPLWEDKAQKLSDDGKMGLLVTGNNELEAPLVFTDGFVPPTA